MESLQTTLLRFYIRQVLLSCGFSLMLTFLFVFAVVFVRTTDWDLNFTILYVSLIVALGFSALSLTLFLNMLESIRNHVLLSGIAWMGLPMLLLVYVICLVPELISLISTIPYMFGLATTFWRFRKTFANSSNRKRLEIVTKENRTIRTGSNSDGMPGGGDWA
jgi:hypothetical protein